MRLSGWLRRQRPALPELVRKALAEMRAGDPDAALALVAGHYSDALAALKSLGGPTDTTWLQLAARLQYRSGNMAETAAAAERALAQHQDAATWNLLGRARLWLRHAEADRAFARAAALDPGHFVRPHRVSRNRFEHLAEQALDRIPQQFQRFLQNTLIVTQDLPALDTVRRGEDPDLLGLYEGATVLEHGLPERIVLFQKNHENTAADEVDLMEEVDETLRHEVGHHFGMEEDELPY